MSQRFIEQYVSLLYVKRCSPTCDLWLYGKCHVNRALSELFGIINRKPISVNWMMWRQRAHSFSGSAMKRFCQFSRICTLIIFNIMRPIWWWWWWHIYMNVAECGMGDFPYIPFWDFSDRRFWAMRLYGSSTYEWTKRTIWVSPKINKCDVNEVMNSSHSLHSDSHTHWNIVVFCSVEILYSHFRWIWLSTVGYTAQGLREEYNFWREKKNRTKTTGIFGVCSKNGPPRSYYFIL